MNDARRGNAETDASIQITSHDTAIAVETPALGWQSALERPPRIRTAELAWRAAAPGVVSFPLVAGALNTVGFVFPEARGLVETGDQDAARQALEKMALAKPARPATAANTGNAERRTTRIKPPGDLLKLEDRLYYLLQPPIEALLIDGELTFPFEPFHYQMDGIAFLYPRSHAIIADEMGLGKTMQTISAMRLLVHRGELRRILLICPKPLVSNWQREFALWAPEIPLNVVGGTQQRRHFQWRQPEALVTIANYELLLRDEAVVTDPALHYDLVALDEAQRIKNSRNSTAQVVRKIARTRSWALTGTPIENSPDDLVGIFEFLSPGYLRPGMKPKQLRRAVADHVLRRTKDAVLTDLPPKLYRDAHVDLTAEQRETYARAEDEGVVQLNDLGEGLTVQHVFELVLRLKQICNFDPATGASAKMERLAADLEECAASGRKAIVFSQWVRTLRRIKKQVRHLHPLEYHGKIPPKEREGVIDRFRHDEKSSVILMSYGAGSVGLNLQFCGYVFLFDRWWNPAVEDQAINRAHRIGAAGPVTVTRFLALQTIEERIDQVLEEKRELFDSILGEETTPSRLGMSREEIFGLFKLREPARTPKRAA